MREAGSVVFRACGVEGDVRHANIMVT
jgi:hypothetical protein